MNLIRKIFHNDTKLVEGKEIKRKREMGEIEHVVDTLAYKYSIPQGIIRTIIWTWMQYQNERLNLR